MADKLIVTFDEYNNIVEKLAIEIHKKYKPTVLVGIMRGAAPILDILSRILKLPIAYIVIHSYSGKVWRISKDSSCLQEKLAL